MLIPVRKPWPTETGMGFTHVRVTIANALNTTRSESLDMLADTGALYSVVPASLLERLGIEPRFDEEFVLADGRTILRRVGMAEMTIGARTILCDVIFGEPGDSTLLGVVTLESAGLVVNPMTGTLDRIQFRLGGLRPPSAAAVA